MVEIKEAPTGRQAVINGKFQEIAAGRSVASLTGSAKQIAWATDLRAQLIVAYSVSFGPVADHYADRTFDMIDGILSAKDYDATVRMLLRIGNADWWITHRYDSGRALLDTAKSLLAKQR